jgi:solute carrier family 32 (vesicular inhibitory amino acid transporter)
VINTVVATAVVVLARFVPYLSIVMSFVGAFLTMAISIIIPAAASYRLHHDQMGSAEKLWVITVILIGVGCALSGTASAVGALRQVLSA